MKRTRIMTGLLCTVLLSCAVAAAPAFGAEKEIKVSINGQWIQFSQGDGMGVPFVDENQRTQLPVRKLAEALSMDVSFDDVANQVRVVNEDTEIRLEIDGGMFVNGEAWPIDTSARIVGDRTYMPIRPLFEAMGYDVLWYDYSRCVVIKDALVKGEPAPEEAMSSGWFHHGYAGLTGSGMDSELSLSFTDFSPFEETVVTVEEMVHQSPARWINGSHTTGVSIYNITGADVVIHPLTLKYQVHKITGEDRELIYTADFPTLEGTLPESQYAYSPILPAYWYLHDVVPGTYQVSIAALEGITYTVNGEEKHIKPEEILRYDRPIAATVVIKD